jgi:pimeloyl-ACP methyl ester carboxylesterase
MPFADLTDVRMHYEVRGRGDPLVLVPGLGVTAQIWGEIADNLSRDFCLILPDNRDIGRSWARRPARNVRHYSVDLLELLDHLHVERTHMLGMSMGGIIAQRFAIDHPTRLTRLVLVSCTHDFTPYLRQIMRLIGLTMRWFPRTTFERTFEILSCGPTHFDRNPQVVAQRISKIRQMAVPAAAVARQLHALSASRVKEAYRITMPTLVISGEFDSLIPHCYANTMADLIPDSRLHVIPGAGHNPMMDCPQTVLPMIGAFLADESDRVHRKNRATAPRAATWASA